MNRLPPHPDPPEDADERYRRASARDPSRPSEAVRRSVLAHAARLAAERTQEPQLRRTRWRPALFGTLIAAALAGLVIAPHYLLPGAPTQPRSDAASVAREASPPAVLSSAGRQPPAAPPAASVSGPPVVPFEAPKPEPGAGRHAERAVSVDHLAADETSTAKGASAPVEPASRPPPQMAASQAHEANSTFIGGAATADAKSGLHAPSSGLGARQELPRLTAADRAAEGDAGVAFRHAAEVGDVPALQTLLARQTDINARDSAGRTALMLATLHNQPKVVLALLTAGADPNISDAQGITPLNAAMAGGHQAITETLQRYGAR